MGEQNEGRCARCSPNPPPHTYVNGVFEGGGSKGLMYVGALRGCEQEGVGFQAVAGSSAGAMTSMLVALGFCSHELERMIPEALKKLGNPLVALLTLGRRSLLSSKELRKWLAAQLDAKLGPVPDGHQHHTFADLKAKTGGVSLYVVAMDLATGQPIVFSPDLTPDASVADAVVASSAIPVAFPSPRVEIDGETRRLADGGVYSNYPSFVFLDGDFRAAHTEIDDGADGRETLGFVLDDIAPEPVVSPRSDIRPARPTPLGSDRGSAMREFGAFGGFVTSPFGHLTLCVLPLLLAFIGASWFVYELDKGLPYIGRLPNGIEDTAVLALVVLYLFVLIQLVVLALVVIRLGRSLADEGLMGTKAALGVGPNVPYWVGVRDHDAGRGHRAVRLLVPSYLSTLKGSLTPDEIDEIVEWGCGQTLHAFFEGPVPTPPKKHDTKKTEKTESVRRGVVMWLASGAAFCVGVVVMLYLTFDVVREADEGRIGWWQLLAILGLLGVLEWLHIRSRSRRASFTGMWLGRLPSKVLYGLMLVSILAGMVGAGILWGGNETDVNLSLRDRLRVDPVAATAWLIDDSDELFDGEFFDDFEDEFADFDPAIDDASLDAEEEALLIACDDEYFDTTSAVYLDEAALDACIDAVFDRGAGVDVEFEDDFGDEFTDDFDEFDDIDFLDDFETFDIDGSVEDPDDYLAEYENYLERIGYYDDADDMYFYEVDLENFDLEGFDPDGLDTGYFDLDRNPLVRCFRVEDCVVMRSKNLYPFGEPADVRYNGQNVLFFDDDRWRFTFTGTALSALYLLPIAIGYQLWLLASWKHDQEVRFERSRKRKTG